MSPTTHAITDIYAWTGTWEDGLTEWLGQTEHTRDGAQLVLHTLDGDIWPRPGSALVKWSDGEITVASPRAARRVYGPHGLLGAYTDRGRALQRVLWLIAHHPDKVAADPALTLQALDADPAAHGWCPPGCTGDCEPDPAVIARHAQI